MSNANSPTKSARLETRVSKEQKALIELAASYAGRTVSDFVVSHVEVAAKKVVDEYERLCLDKDQSRILMDAILYPKRPNKKLRNAVEGYRKRVESR